MRRNISSEALKPLAKVLAWAFSESQRSDAGVFPDWLNRMLYTPETDDARSAVALVAALDISTGCGGPSPSFEDLAPLFEVFEDEPYDAGALAEAVVNSTCPDVSPVEAPEQQP